LNSNSNNLRISEKELERPPCELTNASKLNIINFENGYWILSKMIFLTGGLDTPEFYEGDLS
jgi:hypothetical protein